MTWTQEEIDAYSQLISPILDGMYKRAEIPESNPEEREKYLTEQLVGLELIDYKTIARIVKNNGKPKALNMLERIAILEN